MITKILAIAILAVSCTSKPADEKPAGGTVQLSQTEITVDFEEQDTYLTVTADADWGTSVADPKTFLRKSLYHKINATTNPIKVAIENPINVSFSVILA